MIPVWISPAADLRQVFKGKWFVEMKVTQVGGWGSVPGKEASEGDSIKPVTTVGDGTVSLLGRLHTPGVSPPQGPETWVTYNINSLQSLI